MGVIPNEIPQRGEIGNPIEIAFNPKVLAVASEVEEAMFKYWAPTPTSKIGR